MDVLPQFAALPAGAFSSLVGERLPLGSLSGELVGEPSIFLAGIACGVLLGWLLCWSLLPLVVRRQSAELIRQYDLFLRRDTEVRVIVVGPDGGRRYFPQPAGRPSSVPAPHRMRREPGPSDPSPVVPSAGSENGMLEQILQQNLQLRRHLAARREEQPAAE